MTPKEKIQKQIKKWRRANRVKAVCHDQPPYSREELLQTGVQWPVNLLAKRVAGLEKRINANRKDKP